MKLPHSGIELQAGAPVQAGSLRITPFARRFFLPFPFGWGGIAWSRPAGVLVQRAGAEESFMPVVDSTWRAIFAILTASAFGFLLIWLLDRLTDRRR